MTVGVKVAVTHETAITSAADQTFTSTDLGGLIPKAAIFIMTSGIADGVTTDNCQWSIGFADGVNEAINSCRSNHGVTGQTGASRKSESGDCVGIMVSTGSSMEGKANFKSFQANSVTVTWNNPLTNAYKVTVIFFAGDNVDAAVGLLTLGAEDTAVVESGLTFLSDLIFFAGVAGPSDAALQDASVHFGVCQRIGLVQRSINNGEDGSVSTSNTVGQFSSNRVGGKFVITTGAFSYSVEVTDVAADGFTVVPRGGTAGTDKIFYLALGLKGGVQIEVGTMVTPTVIGHNLQAVAFKPQAAILGMSRATAIDTADATEKSGSWGVSAITETKEVSNACSIEDAIVLGNTNTSSVTHGIKAVDLDDDTGAQAFLADFVSLANEGVTLDFTTTDTGAARQWWYVAISGDPSETERDRMGRRPVKVVELNLDFCKHTYGRLDEFLNVVDEDNWSDISTGTGVVTFSGGLYTLTITTGGDIAGIEQQIVLTAGQKYFLQIDPNSPVSSHYVDVQIGTTSGGDDVVPGPSGGGFTSIVDLPLLFTAPPGGVIFVRLFWDSTGAGRTFGNIRLSEGIPAPFSQTGAELMSNGDFDTDLTDWDDFDTGGGLSSWAASNNELRNAHLALAGFGGGVGKREQDVAVTNGATYTLAVTGRRSSTLDIGTTSGGTEILAAANTGGDLLNTEIALKSFVFTATATTIYIQFTSQGSAGINSRLDDVSLRLFSITTVCDAGLIDAGTAQSGSATNIRLAATAPAFDLANTICRITAGEGAGQESLISAYNTSTKDATTVWTTAPDSSSVYSVHDADGVLTVDRMCFNTRKTCQDVPNYDPEDKVYRFVDDRVQIPEAVGIEMYPCISQISLAPTRIMPTKGLGDRASATVKMRDFPHHDRGIDKYIANRTYTAEAQGTFFGKLLARNPYYQNRVARVLSGYVGTPWDWADFDVRTYVIDSIAGPDARGNVSIKVKDVLKIADDKRALIPRPSTGELAADITDAATSLTLSPAGVGDEEYPASSFRVRIGEELIDVGSRTAEACSSLTRAVGGTTASAHDDGDTVQKCRILNDENVVDFMRTALTGTDTETGETFAGVPSVYINDGAWNAVRDAELAGYDLTRTLSEPLGVSKAISELMQIAPFFVWWDERQSLIRLKPLTGTVNTTLLTIIDDDSALIMDKTKIKEEEKDRVSEVWIAYVPIDQTEVSEFKHFRRLKINADLLAEGANQYGERRIRKLFAPWFDASNAGQVVEMASRILAKFRDNQRVAVFRVDPKDTDLWTGDLFFLSSRLLQNFDGSNRSAIFRVMSVRELDHEYEYEAREELLASGRTFVFGPDSLNDYDVESEANRNAFGFFSNDAGLMSDATDGYGLV